MEASPNEESSDTRKEAFLTKVRRMSTLQLINPTVSLPSINGPLQKLDTLVGFIWLDRYFELDGDRLCWYFPSTSEDNTTREPDDSVLLSRYTSVESCTTEEFNQQHVFKLKTWDSSGDLVLGADSESTQSSWVEALRVRLDFIRTAESEVMHRILDPKWIEGGIDYRVQGSGLFAQPRSVSVPKWYTVKERSFPFSRRTVYLVVVRALNWTTERRYSEFVQLHDDIQELNGEKILGKLGVLPPKSLFSLGNDEAEERRRGLEKFLQELVTRTSTLADLESPLVARVRSFLEPNLTAEF